jgi:hypothetical protein
MSTVEDQERVLSETVVTLQEAADLYPGRKKGCRLSAETVRRWTKTGVRGQKLEFALVGVGIRTSIEALHRFFARLQGQDAIPLSVSSSIDEARDLAALSAEFNIR